MNDKKIIDVWAQNLTARMAQEPWLESLRRWTQQSEQQLLPSVEDTLAAMDSAGVDLSLLSAWHGPRGALISNAEVEAQIARAPDRFRGLLSVDLTDPMSAVREIRSRVENGPFVGVRVTPWLWDLPPNDRRYYPVSLLSHKSDIKKA